MNKIILPIMKFVDDQQNLESSYIIEVRAPNLSPQAKETLARACWGFVKEGEGWIFDELFGNYEKKFFDDRRRWVET
jgi:hypothetical protein